LLVSSKQHLNQVLDLQQDKVQTRKQDMTFQMMAREHSAASLAGQSVK
jgi:hypothetical protein